LSATNLRKFQKRCDRIRIHQILKDKKMRKILAVSLLCAASAMFGASADEIYAAAQAAKAKGDLAGALGGFEKACEASHAEACRRAGLAYDYGMGATQDYAKAAKFYEKSCELGDANGCSNLADVYGVGRGVERSEQKSFELFNKSCEMGSSGGCYGLAGLYESGKGAEKSSEQAAKFYKKSCELGLDLGCEKAK